MTTSDDDFTGLVAMTDLTRRVALEDYYGRDLTHHAARRTDREFHEIKDRIDRHKAALLGRALPGDEWWGWVSGTEPLMQSGGIALVRSGEIVYAEQHWIS